MTYDELKTNIANFLNRSDLTSQIDFFIDATEAELNRILRVKDMIKRATATADAQYISLPTDWLEAINVQIDSNEFTPLFQQSIESLDVYRKANNNVSGQPIYYAIVDNSLELAPTPDSSYTWRGETDDAAEELLRGERGGRRIIKTTNTRTGRQR